MMVYTVTLNPALDLFLSPQGFVPGGVNRYGQGRFFPGGKGINVSLLLGSLGAETTALGFGAGFTGRELEEELRRRRCQADFLFLEKGLTRVNVKIVPEGMPETALNGGGPEVHEADLEKLAQKLEGLVAGDFLVLAGSVPQGMPKDVYPRLMDRVPQGVRVVLDASGEALGLGVKARPWLVKPNLEELGEVFGTNVLPENAEYWAKRLQEMGARNVLVSMGGQGALLVCENGRTMARRALAGKEVSAVGAGDSMVAGFLYGILQGWGEETALLWGMAAGAATAFQEGIASGERVKELMESNV